MGIHRTSLQRGFSTVELLVTLLVASLFIGAGYSLYAFVLSDTGTAKAETKAMTTANEYLEQFRVSSTSCPPTNAHPYANTPITVPGLSNVLLSVDITCPDGAATATTKVLVTVAYGNSSPQKTIQVSSYAGPETSDTQDYNIGSSFRSSAPATPIFYWTAQTGATKYYVKYKVYSATTGTTSSWSALTDNMNNTTYTYPGPEVFRNDIVYIQVTASNGTNDLTISKAGSATVPAWNSCALQNAWTDYHPTWSGAQFTKTSAGVVLMRGLIKYPTSTPPSGTVICNLPSGFRPDGGELIFFNATNSTTAGRLNVGATGNVTYWSIGNGLWESLSSVVFATGSTGWQTATPANTWVDYANGYSPVKYKPDGLGRIHVQGLAKSGSVSQYSGYTLGAASNGQTTNDIFPSYNCLTTGALQYNSSAMVMAVYITANGCWSVQGMFYPSSYTGVGGWQSPSLTSPWINYASGFNNAGYIKSSDGIVSLRGLIKTGTSGTIFTLPSGYRPNKSIICYAVSSSGYYARVDVNDTGIVIARESSGLNSTWLSLAGCSFLAEN